MSRPASPPDTSESGPVDRRRVRGQTTKAAIVAAAEELFRERGYEATTMRAVAERAGVAIGNAYYYFDSKEALVQGFYSRLQADHAAAAAVAYQGERRLGARIEATLLAWLDEAEPLHDFLVSYACMAANPRSPLSPFSEPSADARAMALTMWEEVVAGSSTRIPAALRTELPRMLWMAQLGMVLFWLRDDSPNRVRTRDVAARSAGLIERLIRLSSVPGVSRATDDLVALVRAATT